MIKNRKPESPEIQEIILYTMIDLGLSPYLANFHFRSHSSTIFHRSDAAATIYFAARFVRLQFEGGYYSRAAFISLESPETSMTAAHR